MSFKHKLRSLLLCIPLLLGALGGMPMRPEEIEELMHSMNQQRIEYVVPLESENGDGKEGAGVRDRGPESSHDSADP